MQKSERAGNARDEVTRVTSAAWTAGIAGEPGRIGAARWQRALYTIFTLDQHAMGVREQQYVLGQL